MMRFLLPKLAATSVLVLLIVSITLALFVLMAWINNVSTEVSKADIAALESGFGLKNEQRPRNFDEELQLIREVQRRVFSLAPMGPGIPNEQHREPTDLLAHRQGLCYDRSRTIDKALKWLGFDARHVYILFRKERSFPRALLTYRHPSHAITEVRTSRGWMVVDSNTEWISVTKDGQPVRAADVWLRVGEFETLPSYMSDPYWTIPGLYSRGGQLFKPFLPFPDLNWPDFLRWGLAPA